MSSKTSIQREDIMDLGEYTKLRKEKRGEMVALKKNRRMDVGPFATFYFENYDTMWYQVHEMLVVEQGGEEQIADELTAYNPLIPKGSELVATFMIEIEDPVRRSRILATLGGIEDTIELRIGEQIVRAEPEQDAERTNAAGKASSVHFVHFPMTDEQKTAFRDTGIPAFVAITRQGYQHQAQIPDNVRQSLVGDLAT